MLTSRRTASLLWLLLVAQAGWITYTAADERWQSDPQQQPEVAQAPAIPIAEDLELFRTQMIEFLHGTEAALTRALRHPALAQRLEVALAANMIEVPFDRQTYAVFEKATAAELAQLREVVVLAPDFLSIPGVLDSALNRIPTELATSELQATCGNNYEEFSKVVSNTSVVRGLTIAIDAIGFVYSILNTITEVAGATTEDTPYVGKIPSIPLIITRGIVGVIQLAIGFARSDIGYQTNLSELCLADCLQDDLDVHRQPSAHWRGRGCDNRDNNCVSGIDDAAEDRFPPVIAFDASIIGRCFPTSSAAQEAANLAVKATDDCSSTTQTVTLGPVSAQNCRASFSVTARDGSMNFSNLTGPHLTLIVDGQPPQITVPALDACYPTFAAARAAFTGPGLSIHDCTRVETRVDAVEKECVTDLGLTAVDACGNQATVRRSVRLDGTPPDVKIERLLIPSVDGLACFATETAARQAVGAATLVSDDCTRPNNLVRDTAVSGTACNLEIRQSATDECGLTGSAALTVRVDSQAPVVTCAVAQPVLYPANNQLVDVGLTYQVSDNCEPGGPRIDVEVTSDEPTRYAYSASEGADPFPDAVVERGPGGSISRILLRAQRSQTTVADGRVYRIRIIATDSCQLKSLADCYVSVPRILPGPGSAINSGQGFIATELN